MASAAVLKPRNNSSLLAKKEKPKQVRQSNIDSAKALGDAIRTSLGPRGMDKMIIGRGKNVTITNDGATILKEMKVTHPVAQMLSNMSQSQDIEAGDGTTTVVIYAASFLQAADKLLEKELHPTKISDGFKVATDLALNILQQMAIPVDLTDREALIKNASTSLSSKVVSQNSNLLAPLSVDAVLRVIDPNSPNTVDLKNIRVINKLGGTIEDTELILDGVVLNQKVSHTGGHSISLVEKAKIGFIQFCISPPKTDMESNIVVSDYTQMDRVLRDQRMYMLNLCKAIQKTGCNVLLIQKSILRDALTDQSLHFLNKMKIMVIQNIERDEVEFICKSVGCRPVASIDHFTPETLGFAETVEEISTGFDKYVKISGINRDFKTASIVVRGSNELILEEASRSIHDALCVTRAIVKSRHMIAGGGAPEIEMSYQLEEQAQLLTGTDALCVHAFAQALEHIPVILVESCGLNPVDVITELRRLHSKGDKNSGFNVKKVVAVINFSPP
ncbi:hypothetical protein HZS_2563 [Henneguya salminicola]|nr:hypothetical protein HZS_2563 [Henneguya salminicola]